MDHNGCINLVLPGRGLILDYGPTENLLNTMGTSVKELIEMFIGIWAEYRHVDQHFRHHADGDNDYGPSFAQLRVHAHWMVMDIVFENAHQRYERGEVEKFSLDTMRDAEKVMLALWDSVSTHVCGLVEELGFSEIQVSRLKFVSWMADDFIISLPRHSFAAADEILRQQVEWQKQRDAEDQQRHAQRELERQQEKEFVQDLRDRSPLCYHVSDRDDDQPA